MIFKEPYTVEEAEEALQDFRGGDGFSCRGCGLDDYLEDMIDALKAKSEYTAELEQTLKSERTNYMELHKERNRLLLELEKREALEIQRRDAAWAESLRTINYSNTGW